MTDHADVLQRQILDRITQHSLCFLRIDTPPHKPTELLGSATYVKFGKHRGFLTAAHVVDVLPKQGRFGISRYIREDLQQYKSVDVSWLGNPIVFKANKYGRARPDLAFVPVLCFAETLEITSNSYFDVSAAKKRVLNNSLTSGTYRFFATMGTAKSAVQHNRHGTGLPMFNAVPLCGHRVLLRLDCELDTWKFWPNFGQEYLSEIDDFRGMSGGGFWAILLHQVNGKRHVKNIDLVGSVFCQSLLPPDRRRILYFHGPKAIYDRLETRVLRELG